MRDQYERAYMVDDVVGHIVCWRILRLGDGGKRLRGMDEISASRVGVALRGGAQRGWLWDPVLEYGPRTRRLALFLDLARETHHRLAKGGHPMLLSDELCFLGEFPYVKPLAATTTMVDDGPMRAGGWR